MSLQFTPYVLAYLAAGSIALATAQYVWRNRQTRAAWPLFLALLAEVDWAWAAAAAFSLANLRG